MMLIIYGFLYCSNVSLISTLFFMHISMLPKDTSAFHTGMFDINTRSDVLRENIQETISYMYGKLERAFSNSILILGFFGLIQTLWRNQTH